MHSLFTNVEGRYTVGAAAAPSRRERFHQLLQLWQDVEFCTDAWLEIDLQDTMNSDAFFTFESELRSVMYAVSRDASIASQLTTTVHSPILTDVPKNVLPHYGSAGDMAPLSGPSGGDSRSSAAGGATNATNAANAANANAAAVASAALLLSSTTAKLSVPPCGFCLLYTSPSPRDRG